MNINPSPASGFASYLEVAPSSFSANLFATGEPGAMIFVNVPPGDYTITTVHDERTCAPLEPFASDGAGGGLVRTETGYAYGITFVCTP